MKGSLVFLPLVVVFVCGENVNPSGHSKWSTAMKVVKIEMKECLKVCCYFFLWIGLSGLL